MAASFAALEALFAADDRSHFDEDTWISLRATRRALAEIIPRQPPRLLEGVQPAFWQRSEDLARMRPVAFHRLTSFTPRQFSKLLRLVEPYIRSSRSTLGLEEADKPSRGRHVRVSPHHALFLVLHRLRTGTTFASQLGPFSPWRSQTSLHANFWHVLGAIEAALGHLVKWPSPVRRRWLAEQMGCFEGCIGFVDATELLVTAPGTTTGRKETFSGKKRAHTVMMQVVVDPFGNILHIDGGRGGRRNDVNLWRESAVGKAAAWEQGRRYFSDGEYLIGDCGYGGCSRILIPYRDNEMPHTHLKGRARRVFSNLIRRYRAVNEYIFGVIKLRYKMLGGIIAVSKRKVPLLFKAAALLVQWSLQDKPLRVPGFYDRENRRVSDWEGRCFSADQAYAPSLVDRLTRICNPPPHATQSEHDIAEEIQQRICVAGTRPAALASSPPARSP